MFCYSSNEGDRALFITDAWQKNAWQNPLPLTWVCRQKFGYPQDQIGPGLLKTTGNGWLS